MAASPEYHSQQDTDSLVTKDKILSTWRGFTFLSVALLTLILAGVLLKFSATAAVLTSFLYGAVPLALFLIVGFLVLLAIRSQPARPHPKLDAELISQPKTQAFALAATLKASPLLTPVTLKQKHICPRSSPASEASPESHASPPSPDSSDGLSDDSTDAEEEEGTLSPKRLLFFPDKSSLPSASLQPHSATEQPRKSTTIKTLLVVGGFAAGKSALFTRAAVDFPAPTERPVAFTPEQPKLITPYLSKDPAVQPASFQPPSPEPTPFNLEAVKPTIGIDFHAVGLTPARKLRVWDTAGGLAYTSIVDQYKEGHHGVVICYDITNEDSFEAAQCEFKKLTRTKFAYVPRFCTMMLVGCKADLQEQRRVSFQEAQAFAKENGLLYAETSAKTGAGIKEMLTNLQKDLAFDDEPEEAFEDDAATPSPHAASPSFP